jgi:hypothetical protein
MSEKLTRLTWNQFGEKVDKLFLKVKSFISKEKIKLTGIVPILREGVFIGLPFAFKFNTLKIIPIQFKYFLKPGIDPYDQVPTLVADIPKLYYKFPKKPTFLVTDIFPGEGKTAAAVGKKLKERFPKSQLIYVCMFQDVAFKKPAVYKAAIAGWFTDDTDQLSKKEKKKRRIETEFYLMPWQNKDEETAPIVGKEYFYDF